MGDTIVFREMITHGEMYPMKLTAWAAGLSVAIGLTATATMAQDLPDLGGREVVVVTENAYPPLQFLD